jgi:hypothetical protein
MSTAFCEDNWTVITFSNDTIHSCNIGAIHGDSINITCNSFSEIIHLDSIKTLIKQGESHFWSGAGYGSLIGFVACLLERICA